MPKKTDNKPIKIKTIIGKSIGKPLIAFNLKAAKINSKINAMSSGLTNTSSLPSQNKLILKENKENKINNDQINFTRNEYSFDCSRCGKILKNPEEAKTPENSFLDIIAFLSSR
jgi:hypothetical protein